MGHHIDRAEDDLFARHGHGENGVENGKIRMEQRIGIPQLPIALPMADDCCPVHFAGCRRHGQNDTQRQRSFQRFSVEEQLLPEVAIQQGARGDHFRTVNHTAAADGENQINLF